MKRYARKPVEWRWDQHGGLVIYRFRKSPVSVQPYILEWWPEQPHHRAMSVHQFPMTPAFPILHRAGQSASVMALYPDVNWAAVASFGGLPLDELQRRAALPDPVAQASVVLSALSFYGPKALLSMAHGFGTPEGVVPDRWILTRDELYKRWPKLWPKLRETKYSDLWAGGRRCLT